MSEELKYKLYTSGDCIPEKVLFDYIDEKLSPKEQHYVEKHLLDCDLCSDALEGLQLLRDRTRIQTINETILKKINQPERKIVSLDRKSTRLNSSHIQKSRMPSSA